MAHGQHTRRALVQLAVYGAYLAAQAGHLALPTAPQDCPTCVVGPAHGVVMAHACPSQCPEPDHHHHPRGAGHDHCQVCRVAGAHHALRSAAQDAAPTVDVACTFAHVREFSPAGLASGPSQSRAPPVVSV